MFPRKGNIQVGGPSNHKKSYASSFQEHDALFGSYEHLMDCPQPEEALIRLRKIASLVKPLMRKRSWKVNVLTEFLPDDERLLGLNINKTFKICVRLRYTHNPGTFLPIEQCVDTLLHELSHIIFGDHDSNFHALWDELRDDHETLVLRGYTGEGFLTGGNKLGGGGPVPPQHEMRRLARASAEKRRVLQRGFGRTVGGRRAPPGRDLRKILADAADRRATIDRGCASGTAQADNLAQQAGRHTFKTKAEEDDANNRAIAEALFDLIEEEEAQKMKGMFSTPSPTGGLTWSKEHGLVATGSDLLNNDMPQSEEEQMRWALQESVKGDRSRKRQLSVDNEDVQVLEQPSPLTRGPFGTIARKDTPFIDLTQDDEDDVQATLPNTHTPSAPDNNWTCRRCTCINPQTYLVCDACGGERPAFMVQTSGSSNIVRKGDTHTTLVEKKRPKEQSPGWHCRECGTLVEHKWWCCTLCGLMKDRS
ncbi:putative zinc metallopeptidase [Aureobasidium subglaciale]|nr:putative zinc metallopeptidase [Aureobasidium subglaciale]